MIPTPEQLRQLVEISAKAWEVAVKGNVAGAMAKVFHDAGQIVAKSIRIR